MATQYKSWMRLHDYADEFKRNLSEKLLEELERSQLPKKFFLSMPKEDHNKRAIIYPNESNSMIYDSDKMPEASRIVPYVCSVNIPLRFIKSDSEDLKKALEPYKSIYEKIGIIRCSTNSHTGFVEVSKRVDTESEFIESLDEVASLANVI